MKILLEWLEPKNFFFLLSLIVGTFLAFGVAGITFTFDYQHEKLWIGIAFAHILFAALIDDVMLHYVSCDSENNSKTEDVKLSDFLKEAWKLNDKNELRSIEFKDSNGNKTATITETHRR